ncbi:MAG: cation transporter, partial [Frankia sp.]|nr:cation transporter [Frankia sp.]
GASPAQVAMIADALCDGADVTRVIHLRTLHLGPDELLVAAKVELGRVGSAAAVARAIDAAEQRLRAAVPIARVVYLEPDVYVAR